MAYRKFWLKNADGTTYKLTDQSVLTFLGAPQGLGYSNTITTTQYGEFLSSDVGQNFPQIAGEVVFYDDSNNDRYGDYRTFINFLNVGGLEFYYQIPNASTYSMDVVVSSIQKTQSGTDHILRCPFTLQGVSRWKGTKVTTTGSTASYTLVNNGHIPVGFEITINGAFSNPYFTLTQDGEVYGEALFGEIFDSVYVNSNDGHQEVVLTQSGTAIANPLAWQDLSISNGAIYVTFMKLAVGTSTLDIGFTSGSISDVTIEFTPLYRSV